jgi:TolA-binding protein
MRHGALEPLSPEMEDLLGKERNFPPESLERRARVMARARGAFRQTDAAGVRGFFRRGASLLAAAGLVTAFGAVAIAAWRTFAPPAEPGVNVAPPATGAHEVGARAPQSPAPAVEPPRTPDGSGTESEVTARGKVVATPRPSVGGDANALELALLQRARGGVASGKFEAALDAIAEHQRRFPSGRLREEREALRVKALSGLGRNDEARHAAKRFRERFPESVLSNRIEETTRPER